jgi:hypothetical protein
MFPYNNSFKQSFGFFTLNFENKAKSALEAIYSAFSEGFSIIELKNCLIF